MRSSDASQSRTLLLSLWAFLVLCWSGVGPVTDAADGGGGQGGKQERPTLHEALAGHPEWQPIIERLLVKKLGPQLAGERDDQFAPDSVLTKGDLAVMIVRVLRLEEEALLYEEVSPHHDDPQYSRGAPVFGYVEVALREGFLDGDLVAHWKVKPIEGVRKFPACPTHDGAAREPIENEDPAMRHFDPEQPVSRSEFVVVLVELLQRVYGDMWGTEGVNILAEAKALDEKLTELADVSIAPDYYPGFLAVAEKYLLEDSEVDPESVRLQPIISLQNAVLLRSDEPNGGISFHPQCPATKGWVCYLFGKSLVGRVRVAAGGKLPGILGGHQSKYYFADAWDYEGTIVAVNPQTRRMRVRCTDGQGEKELALAADAHVYGRHYVNTENLLCLGEITKFQSARYGQDPTAVVFAPYQRNILGHYPYAAFPIRLVDADLNRTRVKVYRQPTLCWNRQEGKVQPELEAELRQRFAIDEAAEFGEVTFLDKTGRPNQIHLDCLHAGERVAVDGWRGDYVLEDYASGQEFFDGLQRLKYDLLYGRTVRAYTVPGRHDYAARPEKSETIGFMEMGARPPVDELVTPEKPLTTWYGWVTRDEKPLQSELFVDHVFSWFDRWGKAVQVDVEKETIVIDKDIAPRRGRAIRPPDVRPFGEAMSKSFDYAEKLTEDGAAPIVADSVAKVFSFSQVAWQEIAQPPAPRVATWDVDLWFFDDSVKQHTRIKKQTVYLQLASEGARPPGLPEEVDLIFVESNVKEGQR